MPLRCLLILLGFATGANAQNVEIVATVTDRQGRPLPDAVVVAVPADRSRPAMKPREDAILQVDKEFVPKVSVVSVGTAVAFPNHDSVRHHVYSFSPAKKFELPLYQGTPAQPVVFDRPGVVVLGCNIHDWMVAYVYVAESPYFAKTGADGRARIADVPPRSYLLRVWHPQLVGDEMSTARALEVEGRRVELAWSLDLRPEVRVRRAPGARQSGGY